MYLNSSNPYSVFDSGNIFESGHFYLYSLELFRFIFIKRIEAENFFYYYYLFFYILFQNSFTEKFSRPKQCLNGGEKSTTLYKTNQVQYMWTMKCIFQQLASKNKHENMNYKILINNKNK